MKKVLKIFYILLILTAGSALLYKEYGFFKEAVALKDEKESRKELILKDIDENYHSRKEDFYKEAK